jgi:hypothetical protein
MDRMPEVVTHRYNPEVGPYQNICSLPDIEASAIIDRLRSEHRSTLKASYLARRRSAEQWLSITASALLGRRVKHWPTYFFLGDFSHVADRSRPSSLVIPLSRLPPDAITFTLGDSMKIAEQRMPHLFSLREIVDLFAQGKPVAEFGISDESGVQTRFIEVQLWDCDA